MAMQKLNVRFSDETKEKISNSSARFKSCDSDVARAAMNIGLTELSRIAANSKNLGLDKIEYYIGDNQ